MPVDGGTSLGHAQGRISINTSDLNRVAMTTQQVGRQVEQNLGRIGAGAAKAQAGVTGLTGSFGQMAIAAGAVQFARFTIDADKLATAYGRQSVAALHLAGSQDKLNDLLRVYDDATGGVISKAQSMADVTRLQAIGFADSAEELDRFARAARGISIAMGVSQDYVISQLTLAIANQSFMRLDQIGLDAAEAKTAIDKLKASNKGLSDAMIYQQVIMEQAEEKFGGLADSAEAAATGAERAAKSFDDARLAWGELTGGTVSSAGNAITGWLERATEDAQHLKLIITDLGQAFGLLPRSWPSSWNNFGKGGVSAGFFTAAGGGMGPGGGNVSGPIAINEEERAAKIAWGEGMKDLAVRTHGELLDLEADFGRSRADTVADYNKSVAREERDFAIGRARAEADHLDQIADIHQDAARREADAAEDLARTISRSQADSAERIGDARKDAGERLVEMEEDFAKNRERAAEDHRDKMLSAAGRLDAVALLEERKRWARESGDAKEAHDEQRSDLQEQLDERIADENESLAKSIANANEAHQRQLEDARENDRLRLEDMQADFAQRKAEEDADRATRLTDQAQDHADQLAEMDRAHGERIAQIQRNAADERRQLQEAADAALVAAKAADEATRKRVEAKEKLLEDMWDKFHKHILDSLTPSRTGPGSRYDPLPKMASGGYVPRDMAAWLHKGEFVMPASAVAMGMGSNRSINVGDIHVSVAGSTNMGRDDLYWVAREAVADALEEVAEGR